jgi:hypothetical protein
MKTYRQYKQLSESEYLARFANLTDEQLQAKKIQANRLFRAPYNRRLNYMKLMDIIKAIADTLYMNSMDRVFSNKSAQL